MRNRTKTLFLTMILIQGLHSGEEYIGRLWDVFSPARFVTGLVSDDLETGFLVINVTLFIVGLLSWYLLVSGYSLFIQWLIWFWIVTELINGIGHPVWALYEWAYVPGVATAPILLVLAIGLARDLLKDRPGQAEYI